MAIILARVFARFDPGPGFSVIESARAGLRLLYDELLRQTARIDPAGEPTRLNSIVVNGPEHLPDTLTPRA